MSYLFSNDRNMSNVMWLERRQPRMKYVTKMFVAESKPWKAGLLWTSDDRQQRHKPPFRRLTDMVLKQGYTNSSREGYHHEDVDRCVVPHVPVGDVVLCCRVQPRVQPKFGQMMSVGGRGTCDSLANREEYKRSEDSRYEWEERWRMRERRNR